MIRWLTQDWGLKIISLMLAIGLWYYAVGEEGIEITRTVPLEITVKNSQMSILKSSARNLQVTFVAPRALLSDLTSGEIRAVHEIGNEVNKAGAYSFRLEPSEIKLRTPQIRVVRIEPQVIQVALDELIVQKFVIQPHFVGEPAYGYKVKPEEVQINPNAVLIEGPKAELKKINAIKTEKIDLVGRIRSFRRTVALDLPPNLKSLSENLFDVYIPIREEFEEKKFEKIPVKILKFSQEGVKVEIEPSAISFVLNGSRSKLAKVTPDKLLVYVDLSGLEPGTHEVPVEMILPDDVSLKDEKPIRIRATLKK